MIFRSDFHVREEVQRFALAMEKVLGRNDWKGGWDHMTPVQLLRRLRAETNELERALKRDTVSLSDAMDEAVDVANFAMMIHDRLLARALSALASKKENER